MEFVILESEIGGDISTDCTAALTEAVALLAKGMAVPSRRAHEGRDCGAAENSTHC